MDLSIIIVNWNTRELVCDCLRSLPAATAGLACEVLVVDNASGDDSVPVIQREFPHVRVIETGENLGFAGGNNRALAQAGGDMILLLNPDTVCPPGSLVRLVSFARRHENLAAVGPRLVDRELRPTLSWGFFPRLRDHWLGFLDPRRIFLRGPLAKRIVVAPPRSMPSCPVDYVVGACLLMPRDALTRVGLLDERFFLYFEETDWCYRIKEAGWKVYFVPGVCIYHYKGQSTSQERARKRFRINRSALLFFRKHYGVLPTLGLRLMLLLTSISRVLLWLPRCVIGPHKQTARQEVIYNWRTVTISLFRDDMFDGELLQIG